MNIFKSIFKFLADVKNKVCGVVKTAYNHCKEFFFPEKGTVRNDERQGLSVALRAGIPYAAMILAGLLGCKVLVIILGSFTLLVMFYSIKVLEEIVSEARAEATPAA